jgi:hypothetical protein
MHTHLGRSAGALLVVLLAAACDQSTPVEADPLLTEALAAEIIASPEAAALMSLHETSRLRVQKAIVAGVSISQLREVSAQAWRDGDDTELGRLMFGDVGAAREHARRIDEAAAQLLTRYPALSSLELPAGCQPSESSIRGYFDALEADFTPLGGMVALAEGGEEESGWRDTCGGLINQAMLLTCAAGCSLAGPVLGLGCAWICWCAICFENSEVADAICPENML